MNILIGLIKEIWYLLEEMAPYLLLGFAVAGVLHVLLPKEKVTRHLSHNRFSAVVKASVFGIPLPLCSCGVIPVAAHLEKQGARRGPILSFLISTPTTGVD
ncbi:MAG: permease, partial [Calditrichaeota bacterium]|nr:permease [Calditrichota bacterium]